MNLRRLLFRTLPALTALGLLAGCVPPPPIGGSPSTGTPPLGAPKRIYTGWLPYWDSADALDTFNRARDLMSEISPFWYVAVAGTRPGTIDLDLDESTADRTAILDAARAARVPVVPTVRDGLGARGMAAVLADPAARAAHVAQLVALAVDNGYAGVDIDYENFAFSDGSSTWATTRPLWVSFVAELGGALRARGKLLAVTVPPEYDSRRNGGSGYWVYDYAGIAPHADRVRIMAYEFSFSSPGPTAPLGWVGRLAEHAAETIPPNKVQLGVPTYGYDWITGVTGQCPTGTTTTGRRAVTSRDGGPLAASVGATPVRDGPSGELTFSYTRVVTGTGPDGVTPTTCELRRTVWYPDAMSTEQKAQLVPRYGFLGLAQWAFGGEDPAQWDTLRPFAQKLNGPAGYEPFGSLDDAVATPAGVQVSGWVIDPETDDPLDVHVYFGNTFAGALRADWERTDLPARYPYNGSRHGFSGLVDGPRGLQWVCVYAIDQGAGTGNPRFGCKLVSLPTGPPTGWLDTVTVAPGTVTARGWALDPDTTRSVDVHVYVDGVWASGGVANWERSDLSAVHPGYGTKHGFSVDAATTPGPHQVCVFAIDLPNPTTNPRLGCRSVVVP